MSSSLEADNGDSPLYAGFGDVLRFVYRRRWFILTIVVIAVLLAYLAAAQIQPRYTATATLVFDRSDTRFLEAAADFENENLEPNAIETEMDVLKTRLFVGQVVDALKLTEDPAFNSRIAPPRELTAVERIIARIPALSSWLMPSVRGAVSGEAADGPMTPGTDPVPADPEASDATTPEREAAITKFLQSIDVDRSGQSLAVSIRVFNSDPTRAAELANAVGEVYIDWSLNMKRKTADTFFEFFRSRAGRLEQRIADLEREITEFSAKNGLTRDRQDDALRTKASGLVEEISRAQRELADADARLAQATGPEASATVETPVLTALRTQLADLERRRAELAAIYGERHPTLVATNTEIASLGAQIATAVQNGVARLDADRDVIADRMGRMEAQLRELQMALNDRSLAEIRFREFESNLGFERRRYSKIIESLNNIDRQAEVLRPSARFVSAAAVPREPSFPNIPVITAGAGIGAFALALILAIAREGFDPRIHSSDQIRRWLRRPNLGELPDDPQAPGGKDEARVVYHRLLSLGRLPDRTRGLVIALASPGAGSEAAYAAQALAEAAAVETSGTLLAVLDPECAWLADGMSRRPAVPAASAAGRDPAARPRLEALVWSGASDPQAASPGWLDGNLQILFRDLRAAYNLVIVVTPPLLGSSSGSLIARHTDGVVLVARLGKAEVAALMEAAQHLQDSEVPLLGTVSVAARKRRAEKGNRTRAA